MQSAKVSAKGWVVIPKDLREKYGLEQGVRVQLVGFGDVLALAPLAAEPGEVLHGMLVEGPSLISDLLAKRARGPAREGIPRE
jgi:AbrB family looped-hinge helix DNA binding protein